MVVPYRPCRPDSASEVLPDAVLRVGAAGGVHHGRERVDATNAKQEKYALKDMLEMLV